MRKLFLGFVLVLTLVLLTPAARAKDESVLVLDIAGPVTPAMENYLARGIETAERAAANALLIQLDTPGGLVSTTQEIVQIFRASEVPVIVYVSPRGAQAASAGSIITMAAHAAAMAPETVIGAASPVGEGGVELEETIYRKISEDLKATVRNLMANRSEEAQALALEMIDDARAVTADEALAAGFIDAVAEDVPDLLRQLDGMTVIVNDEPMILQTATSNTQQVPMTTIEQVLFALVNPVLLGILLTLGVQAILIEISSPGGWVAGLVGVLAIAVALYGLGQLPVNWLGVGLVIIAFVLFLMEVKAATHGALAVTGIVVLVAGLLVLFNSPGTPDFLSLSIPAALGIAIVAGAFFLFVVSMALRAQRTRPVTGREGLVGQHGPVRSPLSSLNYKAPYNGMVLIAGELWKAEAEEELERGEEVVVTAVDGFTLKVERVEQPSEAAVAP